VVAQRSRHNSPKYRGTDSTKGGESGRVDLGASETPALSDSVHQCDRGDAAVLAVSICLCVPVGRQAGFLCELKEKGVEGEETGQNCQI
jgi:hypothetical protein